MEDSRIHVRPMAFDDHEAVAELIKLWRPSVAFKLRQHYERYSSDAVAERDGEIVGWIRYNIHACNPELLAEYEGSFEKWLYVVEVFTPTAVRREGVGRALMRFVESEGRAADVRHSILMPAADDSTPTGIQQDLMEFYESLGYRLMRPSSENHPHRKAWIMGLQL